MHLGEWPALRVLLVGMAWPLVILAYVAFRLARLSSRGPVFASTGIGGLILLIGPPLVLVVVWLILKWRPA
jgi:hypothetical protein